MTLAHALVYVIHDDISMLRAIGRLLESDDYSVEMFTGGARVFCSGPENRRSRLSAETLPRRRSPVAVKRALQRSSGQWLQRAQRKEVRNRLATLTPGEFEVLKGVIAGRLNKQIASQLGTTEGTIKVHRGRVTEKMGATSVAELVILAQKAGIAQTSPDATKV